MAKFDEITQNQLLRNMLKNIAQELAPQYEGQLVVGRYEPSYEVYALKDQPFLYIAEKRPGKKFLGIFPRTKIRIIFAVYEWFYGGAFEKRDIHVCLADGKAEATES